MTTEHATTNFGFLAEHDALLADLATAAERAFAGDPNTTLIKLRQLGEALAQHIAALSGIAFDEQTSQADLLYRLNRELRLEPQVKELFHTLRIEGNKATHQFRTRHKEAMDGLKLARELAIWFHRSFGNAGTAFKPGPFVPPADPSAQSRQLQADIEKLRHELKSANLALDSSQQLSQLVEQEKQEFEALAYAMDQEAQTLSQQAQQNEQALKVQRQAYEHKIQALQQKLDAQSEQQKSQQRQKVASQTQAASQSLELSEELTRLLIDKQLKQAGWEVDSQELTYAKGARPEKGTYRAISEWPCLPSSGKPTGKQDQADYVLFVGLTPMAVVEAKKENVNVAGKIEQAERYSKGLVIAPPLVGAWELAGRTIAWPTDDEAHYKVPFVYSCNGRPYVPQLKEQSGTWFRDVREPSNLRRALPTFHTPGGLVNKLERDRRNAEKLLHSEPFGYLDLRDYQQKAIAATEQALARDKRTALLAMATGTGKTRTIIGLMYRFLKTERFHRILFLVDRTSLGDQATDAFNEAPLEQHHTLSSIYNVARLGDMVPEAETRVQVATVQAMVKRLFASDAPPPIDQFDCIIIDEAHRGYTLDQEMTEGELATRDPAQYLSSYRRVLEHFDAVKIALTATPARHTSEIFGKPVYTYSYREAVADGWLIDHEPPIRYETLLTQQGIHFDKGSAVEVIDPRTGEVDTTELDDELDFEVDAFNRQVIAPDFNRVICEQLARELDPFGDEKTLIFCATDFHADMVKNELDKAFKARYGKSYHQAAVAKITGKSDKVSQLIRRYKNERHPNIAVTVDLLTTGIDVPSICHLVFMRRVRSRILFEQMIGRATRRCDDIGKTVFTLYDPVDIYAALAEVNTMQPLVRDPNVSLAQLMGELSDPQTLETALQSPGDAPGRNQAEAVLDQLSQKLMRVLRKADAKAAQQPALKKKLAELHDQWGVEPGKLHEHLQTLGPRQAAAFLREHGNLVNQLIEVKGLVGREHMPIIAGHEDEIRERHQSYGEHKRPDDYLDSFNAFINEQLNHSAALAVAVNAPRDLTREQLKEVKLLLDGQGYSEANLQSAVRNQTNHDIAASIIGHIRRAALGEPLKPFEQRVSEAMDTILTQHAWNANQRKWLKRLASQLTHEVILDRETVNQLPALEGGAKRLDRVLDDQLDSVLAELSEAMWPKRQA
ncbi:MULTISPECIES: type I restriction-modification system endonuclease [unclassified Halomonas]|uniref:type I restriction-modification system endonuclease n=1 Tax=unclassified Halomonas TaxID=2609666 RepID=UPI0020768B5A|nr:MULTISPECIES: type I restriction-modification system endonuclease [unclassified Halomonas]